MGGCGDYDLVWFWSFVVARGGRRRYIIAIDDET